MFAPQCIRLLVGRCEAPLKLLNTRIQPSSSSDNHHHDEPGVAPSASIHTDSHSMGGPPLATRLRPTASVLVAAHLAPSGLVTMSVVYV